ncbi:hypothetical protein [Cryptosporangium phraense]|uniref:Uncharacterized protein n=1 Tax=Cryptosporangium phraense TaxID=2593070 RepID=A0A545ASM6_9ACTN|nr:hypothetical protein [Cryptosporangium phraense]TQS44340.1 hypothetical protein FL583_15520 [Cryptosporangium phraense]
MLLLIIGLVAAAYCLRAGYRDAKATANRVWTGHKERVANWAKGVEPKPSNAGKRAGIAAAAIGTAAWLGLRAFFAGVKEAWPDGMDAGARWASRRGWVDPAGASRRGGRHHAPDSGDEDYDDETSTVHNDHADCTPPGCGRPGCPAHRSWAWACNRCGAGGGGFHTEWAAQNAQSSHSCPPPPREPNPENNGSRVDWTCAQCGATETGYDSLAAVRARHNCPYREARPDAKKENPMAAETTVESLINETTTEQTEATAAVDQATEAANHAAQRTTASNARVDAATASRFGSDVTGPLTTVADAQQAYKDLCDQAAVAAQTVVDATTQCLAALQKHRSVGEAAEALEGGRDSMADRDAYATA